MEAAANMMMHAPELYAACEDALEILTALEPQIENFLTGTRAALSIAQLQAAIAKADGEAEEENV